MDLRYDSHQDFSIKEHSRIVHSMASNWLISESIPGFEGSWDIDWCNMWCKLWPY